MIKLRDADELYLLGEAQFAPVRGGLAPWVERRTLDLMRARISEDVKVDELAAKARLSLFHFARMFKQSVGFPPRVYLTRMRLEKACELLEMTDISITEIAQEVGYSSNQVFARVFLKHRRMSPSDYRRAVRDPSRSLAPFRTSSVTVNVIDAPAGITATAQHRRGPDGEITVDVMLRQIDDAIADSTPRKLVKVL